MVEVNDMYVPLFGWFLWPSYYHQCHLEFPFNSLPKAFHWHTSKKNYKIEMHSQFQMWYKSPSEIIFGDNSVIGSICIKEELVKKLLFALSKWNTEQSFKRKHSFLFSKLNGISLPLLVLFYIWFWFLWFFIVMGQKDQIKLLLKKPGKCRHIHIHCAYL